MIRPSQRKNFHLTLNLMVKNLLLSSLSMCKFVLLHESHPYAHAISQFELFDGDTLDQFIELVRKGQPGQTLLLTLEDELLIYTIMDITCKAYLTDLGDELEKMNATSLKETRATFTEIRNTLLKGCSLVMEGIKDTLGSHPEFEERLEILDQYILAG